MSKKAKSDSPTPLHEHSVPMSRVYFGPSVPLGSDTGKGDRIASKESLKLLTGRLISAQEEERKRIARELHDDLNQRIALIAIELEQLASGHPSLRGAVSPIQKHIEAIGHDIHVMSHQLHPSKLDHLGLALSIKSLCAEASGNRGVNIEFFHHGVPARLPKDVELCMFRVAQEALQNALRHSGASKIDVDLRYASGKLKLLVTDNGLGFVVTKENMLTGIGITSMEERLRLIDGELRISSKPSKGTVVEAIAPVSGIKSYGN